MGKSRWLASVMSGRTSDAPTPESIEAAKQATADKRQRVFEKTGIRIDDDGTVTKEQAGERDEEDPTRQSD